jgi:Mn2+/Fe2+ NRAMP family transporter
MKSKSINLVPLFNGFLIGWPLVFWLGLLTYTFSIMEAIITILVFISLVSFTIGIMRFSHDWSRYNW